MKKLLSLLLMLFMGMSMWANTVTFDAAVDQSGNISASEQSITKEGITIHITNGILGTTDGQYRCYKSQTMTISSTVGNITEVQLTCTASGQEKYGPGCFSMINTQPGEYTWEDNIGIWTGEATQFSLVASLNQVRMTEIVVIYTPGSVTPPDPPTPTITEVATIAELNALEDDTEFKFTGSSVCIWSHGQYTYIQDATAATLIYGTLPESIVYNITDVIPGGWQGKKVTYNNLPEVKNVSDLAESTTTQNIPATEITLPNISTDDFAKYIVIKDVLITINTPEPLEPPTPSNHELTNTIIGASANSYSDWQKQGGITNTIYKGNTAGGTADNSCIQMRSKNNSGIVVTTSVGTVKSITIYWNDATADGRTISIYGKNTAYSSPAELYNNDNAGTLIAELCVDDAVNSVSNINITDNYEYWGIRSKNNALYIDAIDVELNNLTKAQEVTEQYTLTDVNGNTITAYPSKLGYMEVPDDLTQRYNVYGVLDYHNGQPEILPIGFEDNSGTITSITNIESSVKKVQYYNMQGIQSSEPFDGVNIVTIEYDNGTKKINKVIKR